MMNFKKIISRLIGSEYLLIFLIFSAAFVFRINLIDQNSFIGDDEAYYDDVANNIIAGSGYIVSHIEALWGSDQPSLPIVRYNPVYPFLLAVTKLSFGDNFYVLKLISVIFGSLSVIVLYYIAKCAFSKRIAIISSILAISSVPLLKYSVLVAKENIFSFFSLLMVYFFIKYVKEKNNMYLIFSFVFAAISYLTWPIAIFFPILLAFSYLIYNRMKIKNKLRLLFVGFSIFLILIFPWLIYVFFVVDFYNLLQDIIFTFLPLQGKLSIMHSASINFYQIGVFSIGYISKSFFIIFINLFLALTIHLFSLINPIVYVFAILGIGYSLLNFRRFSIFFLITLFYGFWAGLHLYEPYGHYDRFLIPLIYLFLILSAKGILLTFDNLKKHKWKKTRHFILAILLISILLFNIIKINKTDFEGQGIYDEEIYNYFWGNKIENITISSPTVVDGYHLKSNWVVLPQDSREEFVNALRKYDVDYVIIYPSYFELEKYPKYLFYNETFEDPDLAMVESSDRLGLEWKIFKLKKII